VAVELEVPVRVGGEPVVVAPVEDDGVVVADAARGQQRLEGALVDEVAAQRVLQVLLPVQLHGALEVAAVVGTGVLVDLDEDEAGGPQVVLGPIGRDEHVCATHGGSSVDRCADGQAGWTGEVAGRARREIR
jgi:hypothetical protein